MKIIYNKNPLFTEVILDEQEKKEFWYKIKIDEMTYLLSEAHFYLEDGKFKNEKSAKNVLSPDYYNVGEGGKSKLDLHCDELLNCYLEALASCHIGDCTCFPCTCTKCVAESLLGINTLSGLGTHSAHKIWDSFGDDNSKTIDEAIFNLANFNPIPKDGDSDAWKKIGGYEQHIDRWKSEAKMAHDWLLAYKIKHFS